MPAAGSGRGEQVFGLGSALASAMRKVVDALPESQRATASDVAQRFLVDPETDLLARRQVADEVPDAVMIEVRRAVLAGHKLRIHYAAVDRAPRWRTVDPIGLVTVRGKGYLLATSGAGRISGDVQALTLGLAVAARQGLCPHHVSGLAFGDERAELRQGQRGQHTSARKGRGSSPRTRARAPPPPRGVPPQAGTARPPSGPMSPWRRAASNSGSCMYRAPSKVCCRFAISRAIVLPQLPAPR